MSAAVLSGCSLFAGTVGAVFRSVVKIPGGIIGAPCKSAAARLGYAVLAVRGAVLGVTGGVAPALPGGIVIPAIGTAVRAVCLSVRGRRCVLSEIIENGIVYLKPSEKAAVRVRNFNRVVV